MIQLDIDTQGIATLVIHQPHRAMNVIDWDFAQALNERLDQIAQDEGIKGVILTSGKGSFVAGADLAIMGDFVAPGVSPKDAAHMIGRIGAVLRRLETLGKPVVGASTGTALGGGLELLLACHHRIAADEPGAVYGLPEVSLGLLPGAGGTQRLPRLLGMAKALPLMLGGRHIKTHEALALGVLDQVVPPDRLLDAARTALREGRVPATAPWDQKGFRLPGGDSNSPAANELFLLLNGSTQGRTQGLQPAPQAIASCVYEGSRLPIDRALRIEQLYFAQLVQGDEAQAMIRTLFFSRQALEKAPGRPAQIPRGKLSHIAVPGDSPGFAGLKAAAEAAGLVVGATEGPGIELVVGDGPGQLALRWFQVGEGDLPPVVEIAPHAATTDEQLARGFDLVRQLRAVPVLLNASASAAWPDGYVVACIQAALGAAHDLVSKGVSPVVLNNALLAHGWPSLTAMAAVAGKDGAAADIEPTQEAFDVEALAARLARALHETASAATASPPLLDAHAANLAAVLGAGYPRHLGGPLCAAQTRE